MLQPNLLRAAIIRAGYTQGEYAKLIGISQNSLTSRLNGERPFTIDEVDRTRAVLSIDNSEICDIFFGTESLNREIEQGE
ncbi:MAG: helix-turn-helix transcriptional regulator [Ruminococcus sp.]|nr:helix-turn-helix transcriptional regulator [Ruminococcus sp.]MBP5432126.1 helix-turn-helix transcriptional regulator [Ruminococcus sp.]